MTAHNLFNFHLKKEKEGKRQESEITTADLTMTATIINEETDMIHVDMTEVHHHMVNQKFLVRHIYVSCAINLVIGCLIVQSLSHMNPFHIICAMSAKKLDTGPKIVHHEMWEVRQVIQQLQQLLQYQHQQHQQHQHQQMMIVEEVVHLHHSPIAATTIAATITAATTTAATTTAATTTAATTTAATTTAVMTTAVMTTAVMTTAVTTVTMTINVMSLKKKQQHHNQ
jgi:hypothetical protein